MFVMSKSVCYFGMYGGPHFGCVRLKTANGRYVKRNQIAVKRSRLLNEETEDERRAQKKNSVPI